MSAPDFYFVNNAVFRHIHDKYGRDALIRYWTGLGRDYYAKRAALWKDQGAAGIATDWKAYFLEEPQAVVDVTMEGAAAILHVKVCPAIKHLRDSGREIVPYFCEHCDHVCSAMAGVAGFSFARSGGMGSCEQRFEPLTVEGRLLSEKGGTSHARLP